MPVLVVQITRLVDASFPVFVECMFVDAFDRCHRVIEKSPVVSESYLHPDSVYPRTGVIGCEIEAEWEDESGRSLARINTERPWGIESTEGETRFVVASSDLRGP